jgi:RND family efflux transporter MFP subunit
MNYRESFDAEQLPAKDRAADLLPEASPGLRTAKRPSRALLVIGIAAGALVIAVAFGTWGHYSQSREVAATAQQHRDFVPSVRIATVRPNTNSIVVSLPATTSAFSVANIYARASGYIDKREVDIGDRVKEGQLLVQITAPELDHQIAQATATLVQLKANVDQAQANLELAQVTWGRDKPLVEKGWATAQQGTVDVQTLKAREAALGVARANVTAQEAQLSVLNQQKAYQRVVAPFDGVVTQRNIDIGSLVQADAVNSTFMFTVMQSNVIRTQVYVPQDQAFGLRPGVDAVVRVPELPGEIFRGKVTRIADALQAGTRTLLTEIDIANPDGVLTSGMYCTVEIHIPRRTPSLLVPAEAIILNSGGTQVAAVEGGTAHLRKVSVARDFGKEVELRDGVQPGDQVILTPPVDLAEGSRVQVRSNASGQTR